jgi:hypothetical protein
MPTKEAEDAHSLSSLSPQKRSQKMMEIKAPPQRISLKYQLSWLREHERRRLLGLVILGGVHIKRGPNCLPKKKKMPKMPLFLSL